MNKNKLILIITICIVFIGIITFSIFWLPSFFVDEFNYINISFSDNILNIVTDPSDLFEKKVSRWTDVSAIFKNSSQKKCEVIVKSETLDINFDLEAGLEYGFLFPKKEDITVSFCGVQDNIYLK